MHTSNVRAHVDLRNPRECQLLLDASEAEAHAGAASEATAMTLPARSSGARWPGGQHIANRTHTHAKVQSWSSIQAANSESTDQVGNHRA